MHNYQRNFYSWQGSMELCCFTQRKGSCSTWCLTNYLRCTAQIILRISRDWSRGSLLESIDRSERKRLVTENFLTELRSRLEGAIRLLSEWKIFLGSPTDTWIILEDFVFIDRDPHDLVPWRVWEKCFTTGEFLWITRVVADNDEVNFVDDIYSSYNRK